MRHHAADTSFRSRGARRSRSGGTYFSARRTRAATWRGVSTVASDRSRTPRMLAGIERGRQREHRKAGISSEGVGGNIERALREYRAGAPVGGMLTCWPLPCRRWPGAQAAAPRRRSSSVRQSKRLIIAVSPVQVRPPLRVRRFPAGFRRTAGPTIQPSRRAPHRGCHRRQAEDHFGLPGMQAPQLHHPQEPAQRPGPDGDQEVLPELP